LVGELVASDWPASDLLEAAPAAPRGVRRSPAIAGAAMTWLSNRITTAGRQQRIAKVP
jgi:hypothetical protein